MHRSLHAASTQFLRKRRWRDRSRQSRACAITRHVVHRPQPKTSVSPAIGELRIQVLPRRQQLPCLIGPKAGQNASRNLGPPLSPERRTFRAATVNGRPIRRFRKEWVSPRNRRMRRAWKSQLKRRRCGVDAGAMQAVDLLARGGARKKASALNCMLKLSEIRDLLMPFVKELRPSSKVGNIGRALAGSLCQALRNDFRRILPVSGRSCFPSPTFLRVKCFAICGERPCMYAASKIWYIRSLARAQHLPAGELFGNIRSNRCNFLRNSDHPAMGWIALP